MKNVKTLILLGGLTLSAAAVAQMPMMGPDPMQPLKRADVTAQVKAHFAMLDANHDGAVTRDEMMAMHEKHMAEMRDQHFKSMDTNNDGSISRAEFDAAHHDGPDGDHPPMGAGMPGGMEHGDHGGPMKMAMRHDGPKMGGGMMLEQADANKDGKTTEAEMLTAALARFDKGDANHDGVLTPAERMAAHHMMGGKRR